MSGKNGEAIVEVLYHGQIAPLTTLIPAQAGARGTFDGGVYYSNGEVCPKGLQIKGSYDNKPTALTAETPRARLSGSHIFGGMLQNEHFGHFMAESLTRLWATKQLSSKFDSVAFYLRVGGRPVARFAYDMLSHIIPNHRVTVISTPTRVEHLAVPRQLGDQNQGFLYGHPAVRQLLNDLRSVPAAGSQKIYVSRSKLTRNEGGILLEHLIEANLVLEGYQIVHPHELAIKEQVALYNAADKIIFAEGSATHLYALVARPEQTTFVIWRRKKHGTFDWQLQSFGAKPTRGIPSVCALWVPASEPLATVRGRAVLDFIALRDQLVEAGLANGTSWMLPSGTDLERELERDQLQMKTKFVRYPQELIGPNRIN